MCIVNILASTTVGCRNTTGELSMQRPAGYYLINILSMFLWFNFLLSSVTYLSHYCFYQPPKNKIFQCSCQNICNCSHVSSYPTHSSQAFVKVKHASCRPYNFNVRVEQSGCVFIRALLCQSWSLERNCKQGAGNWFPASVFSIYGVKYIIWQWCTLISLIVESPISV